MNALRHAGLIHGEPDYRGAPRIGDALGDIANAVTHPDQLVGDVGTLASNAVSLAGTIVTNPGDDFNAAISASVHPEDVFNSALNFASPDAQKMLADSGSFMKKSFKDVVNSDIGKELLTVAASAAYMGMALTFGPVALLVFSVPGLLRGQDFTSAWLDGMFTQMTRAAKAISGGNIDINVLPPEVQAQIMNYSADLTNQIGTATSYLQTLPGGQALIDMTYDKLAKQLQVGEDAAMLALANAKNDVLLLNQFKQSTFDPKTHKLLTSPPGWKARVTNGMKQKQMSPLPIWAQHAITEGKTLAVKDKVYNAARSLAAGSPTPEDFREGFDLGLGLYVMSHEPLGIHGDRIHGPRGSTGMSKAPAQIAQLVDPQILLTATNEQRITQARTFMSSEGVRGFDTGVALYKGKHGQGPAFAYNGTPSAAAGYLVTKGLKGQGNDPAANVNVVQGMTADGAMQQGAETAMAESSDSSEGWFTRLIHWIGF
jgi:hypothetical protein